MNNRGYAGLVIYGIPIGAVIWIVFELWATSLVYDALEPGLEDILRQLDDKMICPPEMSNSDYTICIGKNGEVIVDGYIKKEISIKLDEGSNPCSIQIGKYDSSQVCVLSEVWKAEKLYVSGLGLFNKKTIQISKLISYTKSGSYIKALKLIKYIPK